jgi:hypothetical protein
MHPRLYEAVLVYLQHDMLEIKLKLSKIKYFIVLIKRRTHYFILMADVTIKNVGLLKNSCSLPACLQHAGDLL